MVVCPTSDGYCRPFVVHDRIDANERTAIPSKIDYSCVYDGTGRHPIERTGPGATLRPSSSTISAPTPSVSRPNRPKWRRGRTRRAHTFGDRPQLHSRAVRDRDGVSGGRFILRNKFESSDPAVDAVSTGRAECGVVSRHSKSVAVRHTGAVRTLPCNTVTERGVVGQSGTRYLIVNGRTPRTDERRAAPFICAASHEIASHDRQPRR